MRLRGWEKSPCDSSALLLLAPSPLLHRLKGKFISLYPSLGSSPSLYTEQLKGDTLRLGEKHLKVKIIEGKMLRRSFAYRAVPTDKKAFMELIKTLRYRTEAPISDCSAALKEADGDLDAAVQVLRKRGAARAMKKGDRVTEHGFVVSCVGSTPACGAAVITMCSETDFAARNAHFQATCIKARDYLRRMMDDTNGAILADPEEASNKLSTAMVDELQAAIAVMGENMRVRSITPLRPAPHISQNLLIGSYTHGSLDVADVGRLVGLVALHPVREGEVISQDTLVSVARHFVATSGAEGNYAHQNFFGSDEVTVGKWLKQHGLQFSSSVVLEFGKEPVIHTAPVPHQKNTTASS